MTYQHYRCFSVEIESNVAVVTIAHGPINLLNNEFFVEMSRLFKQLEADEGVRVIVFKSANPDFFLAHADVTEFEGLPPEPPARKTVIGGVIGAMDRLRTMAKPSIALIAGKCRGGGSEFALACDMRFAAVETAVFGQMEVGLGITPGAGAMTRLARLAGRGRALEILLGGGDFSAVDAERYGWVNRAIPQNELYDFGMSLARQIASFAPETVALIKQHVLSGELEIEASLAFEERLFFQSASSDIAKERLGRSLELGLQTLEIECGDISNFWSSMTQKKR